MDYYKVIIETNNDDYKMFDVTHETYIYSTLELAKEALLSRILYKLVEHINESGKKVDDEDLCYFRVIEYFHHLRKNTIKTITQDKIDTMISKYMVGGYADMLITYGIHSIKIDPVEKCELLDQFYYKKKS